MNNKRFSTVRLLIYLQYNIRYSVTELHQNDQVKAPTVMVFVAAQELSGHDSVNIA